MPEKAGSVCVSNVHRAAVLVICSAAAQREAIEKTCRATGCKVAVSHGWRDACLALSRDAVDVILCDDQLRDGSWKDVLSAIAPMPEAPKVVVMAEGAPAGVCAEVMNLGGFDVLDKPVQESDLTRAVAAGCRSLEYEKAARQKRRPMAMAASASATAAA